LIAYGINQNDIFREQNTRAPLSAKIYVCGLFAMTLKSIKSTESSDSGKSGKRDDSTINRQPPATKYPAVHLCRISTAIFILDQISEQIGNLPPTNTPGSQVHAGSRNPGLDKYTRHTNLVEKIRDLLSEVIDAFKAMEEHKELHAETIGVADTSKELVKQQTILIASICKSLYRLGLEYKLAHRIGNRH
jgi:hypothetical protein